MAKNSSPISLRIPRFLWIFAASFFLLFFVVLAPSAHAQTMVGDILPDVHIINLSINSTSYRAGGLVSGSFTIVNNDTVFAPGITYVMDMASGYSQNNGIPTTRYDEKVLGTVSLNPGESQTIPFTYTLPTTVSGTDFGIRIQAETQNGLFLGWQDAEPITISGGTGSLTMVGSWLAIGTTTFDPNAGPTLPQGQAATYNLTVKNTTGGTMSFTPHLTFYDMTVNSVPINTINEPAVSIKAGATQTLSYSLPNFDWKPLVYAGQAVFADSKGDNVIPTRTFRYIVAGPIATIQSILTQSTYLVKGQNFSVTMTYTGAPTNIFTGVAPNGGMATVTISVYNQNNQLVAIGNQAVSLNDASITPVTMSLTAKSDATSATVKASIFNSNSVLSSYSAPLFKNGVIPPNHSGVQTTIIIIILVLVAVVVIYFIWRRWPKARLLSLVIVVAAGSAISFVHSIQAFVVVGIGPWGSLPIITDNYPFTLAQGGQNYLDNHYLNYGISPVFFINTPFGTLPGNSSFTLTGSDQAVACANTGAVLVVNSSFNGSATSTTSQTFSSVMYNHNLNDYEQDFSLPGATSTPYMTSSTPGLYQVNIQGRQYGYYGGTQSSTYTFTDGYQPLYVGGAPPTVSLVANPNQVGSGSSTLLTWTSTGTTTGCVSAPSSPYIQTNNAISNTIGTSTPPLLSNTTYTIVCAGPGGTATSSASITVVPVAQNNAAAETEGVGANISTTSAPPGFESDVDSTSSPTYANPAYFQNISNAGPTSGLVGWWKFDDGSGSTAGDSSGNSYNGTLVNSPTWTTGLMNGALHLDSNSDQYVSVYNSSNNGITPDNSAFTYSAWVQNPTGPILLRGNGDGTSSGWSVLLNTINHDYSSCETSPNPCTVTFGVTIVTGGDSQKYLNGYPVTIVPNQWINVAVVFVPDQGLSPGQFGGVSLYVNGVPNNFASYEGTATSLRDPGTSVPGFYIGANNDNLSIDGAYPACTQYCYNSGAIDDVRVYDTALSATDINDLYQAGFNPVP